MSAFDLTPFDEITAQLRMPTAFQVMWAEAEDTLREACPGGFDVLQIGRTAWDCLPTEKDREAALEEMFYAFWEALQDRQARAEQAGGAL